MATDKTHQVTSDTPLMRGFIPKALGNYSHFVQGFSLRAHTYKFPNNFKNSRLYWGYLPVGNAKFGLCGGMALSALLYYRAKSCIPEELRRFPPSEDFNTELLVFLKACQLATITWRALWNYLSGLFSSARNDQCQTLNEWASIRQSLNNNEPVLLGLIRAKASWYKPWELMRITEQHQVLAYGYSIIHDRVVIHIYDPAHPQPKSPTRLQFDAASGQAIHSDISLFSGLSFHSLFRVNCPNKISLPAILKSTEKESIATDNTPSQHKTLLLNRPKYCPVVHTITEESEEFSEDLSASPSSNHCDNHRPRAKL